MTGQGMSESSAQLQRLLDTESIREVVARYLFAIGRRDWEAVATCFVPGAYADYEFEAEHRIEVQLELVRKGMARFAGSTLMGSNFAVTFDATGAASESIALTAHEAFPASPDRTRVSAVQYSDRWIKGAEGQWRISDRRIKTLWRAWLDPRRDDRAGDHRYADEW
jgi:hypothetical protein